MTRTLRTVAAIILAGLFPLPASAQRTDHAPFVADRPAAATRIVKRFGFDDRPDNPIGLPPNWIRAQHDPGVPRDRPGFPIWNEARVDLDRPAFAGDGSVVLPTRGGSTSLLLDPGVIAVLPTASYLVAAQVNGSGLEHARARVVVRVLDQRGDPIPGATAQSAAVAPGAGWTPIAVAIAADDPASAFLEIELLLLQPREFQRMPLLPEDLHVWPADYSGSIHFDEVTVLQMPSVHLTSPEPSNIIASDTPPELDVRLRDLAGEPLTADITVQDADGRPRCPRTAGTGPSAASRTRAGSSARTCSISRGCRRGPRGSATSRSASISGARWASRSPPRRTRPCRASLMPSTPSAWATHPCRCSGRAPISPVCPSV
jgi:hypothetical protein